MPTLQDADAYFAGTIRKEAWQDFDPCWRETALTEAAALIGRIAFARRPSPRLLENAACEAALSLLETGQDPGFAAASRARAAGITGRSIADASERYAAANPREQGWLGGLYYGPRALGWLSGFLPGDRPCTGRLVCR